MNKFIRQIFASISVILEAISIKFYKVIMAKCKFQRVVFYLVDLALQKCLKVARTYLGACWLWF